MSLHRPGIGEQANKKQCLIKGKQSISEEDAEIDRISSLPKDVIDLILGFLPTQDAVRTCVLSSEWRYVWANHPILLVDEEFWKTMKPKRFRGSRVDFARYVLNRMFVHHSGHINEFGLDISVARHCDVDLWLSLVSRRGVKVLVLENSSETPYTLASCVLSNSNLYDLCLFDGILNTVKSSRTLHKLGILHLEGITLSSWVLVTPLLSSLTLDGCRDTRQFIISAPRLVSLTLDKNDDLNLVPYLKCLDIECVHISVREELEHQGDGESINMMKLLRCCPKISKFSLTGSSIKYLARGIVHEEFPVILNLTRLVGLYIHFNIDQLACILCILRNSRLLQIFDIQLEENVTNDLEVVNYLEELNIVNQRMEQLRVVKMQYFTAARAELLFMKILLQSAPSLKRMLVEEEEDLDLAERLRMSKELMRLQRQFPNAEINFEPNLFSFDSMRI